MFAKNFFKKTAMQLDLWRVHVYFRCRIWMWKEERKHRYAKFKKKKKVNECTANAVKVIQPSCAQRSCTQEFQEIIKSKKSNIIWLPHHQSQIFQRSCTQQSFTQKFKEKERFVSMVLKINVSKSNSSLSLPYFKSL